MMASILCVNVDYEIASEMLWARWLERDLEEAREELDKLEPYMLADRRTKQGRAYKQAEKRWNRVLQDYHHTLMRLGKAVALAAIDSKALIDYTNEVMERTPAS